MRGMRALTCRMLMCILSVLGVQGWMHSGGFPILNGGLRIPRLLSSVYSGQGKGLEIAKGNGRSSYSLKMSADMTNETFIPTRISAVPFCGAGCILLAQPSESSHFFARAAIFLYQYSPEEGARGVILERESAFNMGETAPGIGCFEANTLYIGGENGDDSALMLGKVPLPGACRYVGSGIYLGGLKGAKDQVTAGQGRPKDFKFFFNHSEWAPGVLEKELKAGAWNVVKAPPEEVLLQDSKLGEFWSRARNSLISERVIDN